MAVDATKVRTIYVKELRETLRDRRTVFAALVFPILLYPLMMVGVAQATAVVSQDIRKRDVRIGLAGADAVPELAARLRSVPHASVEILTGAPRDAVRGKKVDA